MISEQRVVLVTGAARRIGAAIATALHADGWNLVLHFHRSAVEAGALCAALNAQRDSSVVSVQAELNNGAGAVALLEQALAAFGRIDGLVNNASAYRATPLGELDDEEDGQITRNNGAGFNKGNSQLSHSNFDILSHNSPSSGDHSQKNEDSSGSIFHHNANQTKGQHQRQNHHHHYQQKGKKFKDDDSFMSNGSLGGSSSDFAMRGGNLNPRNADNQYLYDN